MLEQVKAAFGEYIGRYYQSVVPTTKPLEEFKVRGLAQCIAWAPSRMVDAAQDMLALWLRAEHNKPTKPPALPSIIVAIAKDYTPSGRDYTRQVADRQVAIIPGDPKERLFGIRAIAGDVRAQVAIFATDEPTARSLAAQLLLFMDATENRRFTAKYHFAGVETLWSVQIETPENPAMSIPSDAKNLTILAVDVTLRAQIPLFDAPGTGEPNDGKGTPGTDDPAGYPLVQVVDVDSIERSGGTGGAVIRNYTVEDQP